MRKRAGSLRERNLRQSTFKLRREPPNTNQSSYGYFTESHKAFHVRCHANRQPHLQRIVRPTPYEKGILLHLIKRFFPQKKQEITSVIWDSTYAGLDCTPVERTFGGHIYSVIMLLAILDGRHFQKSQKCQILLFSGLWLFFNCKLFQNKWQSMWKKCFQRSKLVSFLRYAKSWLIVTCGFIPRKIQWHIHTGQWSLVNWWCKALMRHYIRGLWIFMRMAVGLEDGLGLDGDRCISVIPRKCC